MDASQDDDASEGSLGFEETYDMQADASDEACESERVYTVPADRHGEGLQISLHKQARKSYLYHQIEDTDDSSEILLLRFTNDDNFNLD